MINMLIYALVFLGSGLMVYNIYGFVGFTRFVKGLKTWSRDYLILYAPTALLILFLAGYLAVGIFGKPDLIVSGILFGGSIFVFYMVRLLTRVTKKTLEADQIEVQFRAEAESARLKSDFLSAISHEMRTPMNVILGLNDIELKNPALPPESRDRQMKIRQSCRHLLGLVDSILTANRFGTGGIELKQEPFSLSDALDQVNAIAQTLCETKGLSYTFSGAKEAEGTFLGDATQLRQSLLNLLDNAVKFTPAPGSVRFRVETLVAEPEERTLRFIVSDSGIGIDAAFLSRIFDPFAQEDSSATNQYGGSGLGLTHVKNVVNLMGGTVSAESVKGQGAAFTVTLTLPVSTAAKKPEAADTLVSLEGKHILLAEDLPENAEIVIDLLDLEGAETDHVENGLLALEKIQQAQDWAYDAILMDLRMPVMDGLEATRRIRALPRLYAKQVPIIALTANAFESDIRASLEAGMNVHLAKPADADLLYATLRREMTNTAHLHRRTQR